MNAKVRHRRRRRDWNRWTKDAAPVVAHMIARSKYPGLSRLGVARVVLRRGVAYVHMWSWLDGRAHDIVVPVKLP